MADGGGEGSGGVGEGEYNGVDARTSHCLTIQFTQPPYVGVQLRRTALIDSAGTQGPAASVYHGSIGPSGAVSSCSALLGGARTGNLIASEHAPEGVLGHTWPLRDCQSCSQQCCK